jgi:lipopolysaccharide transport system ATP-binding protein
MAFGSYLRLAFAVAAHLDPDILIVDEVLAVGHSAFQQKCLGKWMRYHHGKVVRFFS